MKKENRINKFVFNDFQGIELNNVQLQTINGGATTTEYAILVGLIALIVL